VNPRILRRDDFHPFWYFFQIRLMPGQLQEAKPQEDKGRGITGSLNNEEVFGVMAVSGVATAWWGVIP
jgi:hypothetical protein